MNNNKLHSYKKVERSAPQLGTIIIVLISIPTLCMALYKVLDGFVFSDREFLHLSIEDMFYDVFNLFTIPLYLFVIVWNIVIIIPFIYDFWGTEMIYITDDYLTIDKHALFLHKTKVVKISNIVEISYYNKPKYLPDVFYAFQNEYKVKIKYYRKHRLLKRTLYCGMNFSTEEYTKFGAIIQELIEKRHFTNKYLYKVTAIRRNKF